MQYGTDVKAAAVYSRAAQFLPFGWATALLGDLLGTPVLVSFVHQVVTEAARRLGPFLSPCPTGSRYVSPHAEGPLRTARKRHSDSADLPALP